MNGIFFFGMLNALINPLIYGAFHIRDAAIQTIHTQNHLYCHKIICAGHSRLESCRVKVLYSAWLRSHFRTYRYNLSP